MIHFIPKEYNIRQLWRPVIILFLLIYLTSSYIVVYNVYNTLFSVALLACVFALCFRVRAKGYKQSVLIMGCLLLMQGLTTIVNGENILVYLLASIQLSIACIFVTLFDWRTFKESYILLMTFLSLSSLFFFIAILIIPPLGNINVIDYSLLGSPISNLIIYVSRDLIRNQSIFWEPGAFQTFIITALLLEYSQKQTHKSIIIILIAALITTFSTTGYISLIIILFWFYFVEGEKAAGKLKASILLVAVGSVIIFFLGDFLLDTSTNSAFGKLIYAYENGFNKNNGELTSAGVRYYAFVKPISVFLDYPILGCGFDNLKIITNDYTEGMNTCTFINFFAVYGFFYAVICLTGCAKFAKLIARSRKGCYWVFLILFLTTSSEDYVRNSFLYILMLYGLSRTKKMSYE